MLKNYRTFRNFCLLPPKFHHMAKNKNSKFSFEGANEGRLRDILLEHISQTQK